MTPTVTNLNTPEQQSLWQKRCTAVTSALEQACQAVNQSKVAFPRKATISKLLEALQHFGSTQFNFFLQGFGVPVQSVAPKPRITLTLHQNPGKGMAAQYIFGTIIDQIANDFMVLERAEKQRSPSSSLADTLTIADTLAQNALTYITHLLEKESTVLTYLQKSPNVRVVPYAPVALIGIPLTCHPIADQSKGVARDLLAIPHELGHHLYWNGYETVPLRTDAAQLSSGAPSWIQRWLQEIFADVLTCIIGGPIAALSMQELQLQARNDWLLVDDGSHPVAAFRTYIYIVTLEEMGLTNAALQLTKRWQKKLEDRGVISIGEDPLHRLCFTPFADRTPVTFNNALYQLRNLIVKLVDLFQTDSTPSPWSSVDSMADLTDEAQVEIIYSDFEKWVLSTFSSVEQQTDEHGNSTLDTCWQIPEWSAAIEKRGVDYEILQNQISLSRRASSTEVIMAIKEWANGTLGKDVPIDFDDWCKILEFAGWSTEGPTDGNLSGG